MFDLYAWNLKNIKHLRCLLIWGNAKVSTLQEENSVYRLMCPEEVQPVLRYKHPINKLIKPSSAYNSTVRHKLFDLLSSTGLSRKRQSEV
jgi:hypothetical protein